jgi:ABC-type transport system substrate-binding protein
MLSKSLLSHSLITLLLAVSIIIASGCTVKPSTNNPGTSTNPVTTTTSTEPVTTEPTTTTTSNTTTPSVTTTLQNLKAEKLEVRRAGMQDELALNMLLKPVDANGKELIVEGTLSVKVWEMLDAFDITKKGNLIQSWDGVPITSDDYDIDYTETLIRLTYEDFIPEWWQYGIADIEFAFDGGVVTASKDLLLGKIPGC